MKKLLSLFLVLAVISACGTSALASNTVAEIEFDSYNQIVSEGYTTDTDEDLAYQTYTSTEIKTILDNSNTTQTVTSSESEIIAQMLETGEITREDLNRGLADLATQSETTLRNIGYSHDQVAVIKSYKPGSDAYTHVFRKDTKSNHLNTTSVSDPSLVFRYGLAASTERHRAYIVYDMNWVELPFWQFTDSFGIGWVVADANSIPLATKIDYTYNTGHYYTYSSETDTWNPSEMPSIINITMSEFAGRAVVGNVDLLGPVSTFTKYITGCTSISTQSNSNNMHSIQIFVDYQHTIVNLAVNVDVSLTPDIKDTTVSFIPSVKAKQIQMAKDSHTFLYDENGTVTVE